jgi:hypothetical protein
LRSIGCVKTSYKAFVVESFVEEAPQENRELTLALNYNRLFHKIIY